MIRGAFFVIIPVVTAIFPPGKSGKGIAAKFAGTKLPTLAVRNQIYRSRPSRRHKGRWPRRGQTLMVVI